MGFWKNLVVGLVHLIFHSFIVTSYIRRNPDVVEISPEDNVQIHLPFL